MDKRKIGEFLLRALEALPTIRTSSADVREELKVEASCLEVWISHPAWGHEVIVIERGPHPCDNSLLEWYEVE
jgi:hypothetical protein